MALVKVEVVTWHCHLTWNELHLLSYSWILSRNYEEFENRKQLRLQRLKKNFFTGKAVKEGTLGFNKDKILYLMGYKITLDCTF